MSRFPYKGLICNIFVFSVYLLYTPLQAQKSNFESPLNIPLYLSGSYGDLRLNHFHSGFDLRTQSTTGKYVFAADDGFISRIKIEASGYGKAIYIDHPNGLTSVYAHLEGFVEPIDQVVKNEQYKQSSFALDFTPTTKIKVKKGELIAFSGNTGGSGGPHLHFEIRKTKTQNPINPVQFKFALMDKFTNQFDDLYLYPLEGGTVNDHFAPIKFDIKPSKDKKWIVKLKKPIEVNGAVGIGIDAESKSSSGFSHGLTKIEMTVNGILVYSFNLNEFSYSEMRFANSVSDYNQRLRTGNRIYKLFVDQCNTFDGIHSINNGIIRFSDTISLAKVKINTVDFKGNKAELSFSIRSKKASAPKKISRKKIKHNAICCKDGFTLENDSFKLIIPKGSIYDSIPINYAVRQANAATITPIFTFNNEYIPIHSAIKVSLKIPQEYKLYSSKIVVVNVWEKEQLTSVGGTEIDGWIVASARNFGNFALSIDTLAPTIQPTTLMQTSDLTFKDYLVFTIQDNLSGINTISGYVDGRWVLFEHDPKTKRIFYQFDPVRLTYGKTHSLNLKIVDNCGNAANYNTEFFK